jgi:putative DNA methylase
MPQVITFRLADSLPAAKLAQWQEELEAQPFPSRKAELSRRVENYLGKGHGSAALGRPDVGGLVQDALLHFDGERYAMHAWVVMPTHVHALLTVAAGHELTRIMHSWKSFTASAANRMLGRSGAFWQREYFDRYVRDERHFEAAMQYIEENPVAAGLCARPQEWPLGSAQWRSDDS